MRFYRAGYPCGNLICVAGFSTIISRSSGAPMLYPSDRRNTKAIGGSLWAFGRLRLVPFTLGALL